MIKKTKRHPVLLRIIRIFSGAVIFIILFHFILAALPFPALDSFINRQNSTRFYDKNENLISVLPLENGLRREYYPLKEIPEQMQKIFILSEDANFYHHPGIDLGAVLRAALQNKKSRRTVSGASTITMQLARIIFPREKNSKVNLGVKFTEAFTALRIESKLSKNSILELYMNSLPFGNRTEGAGSAARSLYGKNLQQLTTAQMLALSVIPRRPSYYTPLNNCMNSYNAAMETAKKTSFQCSEIEWKKETAPVNYKYPHCCPHYITWIQKQYNNEKKRIPDEMHLAIDSKLNAFIENEIQTRLEQNAEARIHNGSALVIDNRTGEIIAWVGNGNFEDKANGQVDGVTAENQAGSSMKPFLYAMALEHGFSPNTVLPDIPQDFGGSRVYVPLNFNNRYNGPQRMRVCLASSLNIPAVYILYHLGIDNYMNYLSRCGFDSLNGTRKNTGLSLALGSGAVTLYELVRAFSIFPREGTLPTLSTESRNTSEKGIRVIKKDTASIICSFLSDKNARSLGFGFAKVFDTPYPAIFKTGTSNQFQDIIALGATPRYTAGVWMGNFTGETVIKKTGSSIPAEVVRSVLDTLTLDSRHTNYKFRTPVLYKKYKICALSGMSATEDCPSVTDEYCSTEPPLCTWHSQKNGLFTVCYPSQYQHWAGGSNMAGTFEQNGTEPLSILYPTDGAVFVYDKSLPSDVQFLRIEAYGGSSKAELFLDGKSQGKSVSRLTWNTPLLPGTHTLEIKNATSSVHSTYSVQE